MARAAGTRSQRQASQSQPHNASQPSQTQRSSRRNRVEESDEDDAEAGGDDGDEEMNGYGEEDGEAVDDATKKAYALVRLAIFHEQKRMPLRRDEITKRVMGSKSRQFNEVLSIAQGILRKTWGVELVELQQRSEQKDEIQEKATEKMNIKKKAAPTGTRTWVLRSVLSPKLIELAAAPDDEIRLLEQAERGPNDDIDDRDEGMPPSTGAIFAWQSSDQLGSLGILHVILALILVNGRSMMDNELRIFLKRMRLPPTASIPQSSTATHPSVTLDVYLTACLRQGYLERVRVGEAKNAPKKRGRVQLSQHGQDDGDMWEWRWGPRAMSEIGEKDVARFVVDFMAETAPREDYENENENEDDERETEAREENKEKMLAGIERAAGGQLADII